MGEEKNRLEQYQAMVEDYEGNPSLVKNAIETIRQDEARKRSRLSLVKWKIFAVTAACLLCIATAISVYFSFADPIIVYYATHDVTTTDILDIEKFVEDENLTVKYFVADMTNAKYATTNESEEMAFVMQDAVFVTEKGFDQVKLTIPVLDNAEFEFFNNYKDLKQTIQISDVTVSYAVTLYNGNNTIRASFVYGGYGYYLDIMTTTAVETALEQYVVMLLG